MPSWTLHIGYQKGQSKRDVKYHIYKPVQEKNYQLELASNQTHKDLINQGFSPNFLSCTANS